MRPPQTPPDTGQSLPVRLFLHFLLGFAFAVLAFGAVDALTVRRRVA